MNSIKIGFCCVLMGLLAACGGGGSSGNNSKSSNSVEVSSSSTSVASSEAESSIESTSSSEASSLEVSSSSTPASSSSTSSAESESSVSSSSAVSSSLSSASSSVDNSDVQVGVFIDSVVAGVHYETTPGGHSGETTANGQYQYSPGDTVTFSIGELVFPAVTAKGVVTPLDMAGTTDPQNPIVVNIAALLQSLDTDGNPENGISIDYETASAVAQSVDFDQPYADFAALTEVTNLVANSGSVTTTLVSDTDAVAHLQSSMEEANKVALVGTWYITGEEGFHYVLFILDDHQYAYLDYDPTVINGAALEFGTYSWDQETGVVSVEMEYKSESGLDAFPPMANGNTLTIDGDTITLQDADDTFELTRLKPNETHPLMGGWILDEEDATVVFAFTDEHYMMGQYSAPDEAGQPGIEFGTYAYDVETHAFTLSTLADTNGQWGLSHPCAVLDLETSNDLSCGPDGADIVQTFTIDGDTLTFISEADTIANNGEEQPTDLQRVKDSYDGSIRLNLDITVTVTSYTPGETYQNGMSTMRCGITNDDDNEIEVGQITDQYPETWKLSRDPQQQSWAGTVPAQFNPATGEISIVDHQPRLPIDGHPGFYDEWDYTFAGTYNPGETNIITGTLTDTRDLTWDLDDSVSTCIATYSVIGVLRE